MSTAPYNKLNSLDSKNIILPPSSGENSITTKDSYTALKKECYSSYMVN